MKSEDEESHAKPRSRGGRRGKGMMSEEGQASWRGIFMNIPLHIEVPEALALIVAQPDHRPANAAPDGSAGR